MYIAARFPTANSWGFRSPRPDNFDAHTLGPLWAEKAGGAAISESEQYCTKASGTAGVAQNPSGRQVVSSHVLGTGGAGPSAGSAGGSWEAGVGQRRPGTPYGLRTFFVRSKRHLRLKLSHANADTALLSSVVREKCAASTTRMAALTRTVLRV
jgi:hypothetical protein